MQVELESFENHKVLFTTAEPSLKVRLAKLSSVQYLADVSLVYCPGIHSDLGHENFQEIERTLAE